MTCEIVSIGTELLMGQIVDTDARYLSERMGELGIRVLRRQTVGDNRERMAEAIKLAISRADLVITSGGLGPTQDDITKQVVAECLELTMVRDEKTVVQLQRHAEARGVKLSEFSLQQADFPEGATILLNRRGTAPGFYVRQENTSVAVLPGPPRELTDMFEWQLEPILRKRCGDVLASRYLKVFGMGEPQVQDALIELFHQNNPTLALYCGMGEVTIRLTASAEIGLSAEKLLAPLEKEIRRRLGHKIYATGRDASLSKVVFELLVKKGKMLALAESCTGGMLASMMVENQGASKALLEGLVTYNDKAKMRVLGVRSDTLQNYGAVSAQCASEMAAGALINSGADYALSITGIAGPDGGTEAKPVGTIFVGLADAMGVSVQRFQFQAGDRTWIRMLCAQNALNMLRLRLLGIA